MNTTLPVEPEAATWIEENITSDMTVFEYGSGASTIYFNKKVGTVITVEYSPQKHRKIYAILTKKDNYRLIEPTKTDKPYPYSHISYGSADQEFDHYTFKDYVTHIEEYEKFDMVFINGRSRASCIWVAASRVKSGGFLILNDAERYEYQNAIELFLKENPYQEFGRGSRKTGIWVIE